VTAKEQLAEIRHRLGEIRVRVELPLGETTVHQDDFGVVEVRVGGRPTAWMPRSQYESIAKGLGVPFVEPEREPGSFGGFDESEELCEN
jgi:hypothetical protein